MKKASIVYYLILFISVVFSNANCTTRKIYSGDYPADKTAKIFAGNNAIIQYFDNITDGNLSSLEVLPGSHRVKVHFEYSSDYLKRMNDHLYQITYKTKTPVELEFNALPGKTYYVSGHLESSELCRIDISEGSIFNKHTITSRTAITQELYEPYYPNENYYHDYYRDGYYRRGPFVVYPYYRWPHHCW